MDMGRGNSKYRYKAGKYVEDTTKGGSRLMPKSYKSDALVQVWLDSRKLALLSRWIDQDGPNTRFLSEVVRYTLDMVVELLQNEGWELGDIASSRQMLERKYRTNLNPNGKGKKNLLHNMILESGGMENVRTVGSRKSYAELQRDVEDEDMQMVKMIKACGRLKAAGINYESFSKSENRLFSKYAMEDRLDDFIERVKQEMLNTSVDQEQLRNSIEAARASGILYEEPKEDVSSEMESVVREGMTIEEVNARQEAKDDKLNQALKALAGRPKGDVGA